MPWPAYSSFWACRTTSAANELLEVVLHAPEPREDFDRGRPRLQSDRACQDRLACPQKGIGSELLGKWALCGRLASASRLPHQLEPLEHGRVVWFERSGEAQIGFGVLVARTADVGRRELDLHAFERSEQLGCGAFLQPAAATHEQRVTGEGVAPSAVGDGPLGVTGKVEHRELDAEQRKPISFVERMRHAGYALAIANVSIHRQIELTHQLAIAARVIGVVVGVEDGHEVERAFAQARANRIGR